MRDSIYSVLTGDVVYSRLAFQHNLEANTIKSILEKSLVLVRDEAHFQIASPFSTYRGDEFQGVLSGDENALRAAMLIRAFLRSQFRIGNRYIDAKVAIGVGSVSFLPTDSASNGEGEAYILSGTALANLKPGRKLIVQTPWNAVNEEMDSSCWLADAVISSWTKEQAEAMRYALEGMRQNAIGAMLKINQSAVSQRLRGAQWPAIDKFLMRYEQAIRAEIMRS